MSTPSPSPSSRILYLHGFYQNAAKAISLTKPLQKKLKSARYELVFPDAPFILTVPASANEDSEEKESSSSGEVRYWFCYDAQDPGYYKGVWENDHTEYLGLTESFAALKRCWQEQGPFDAVIGFSQGAVLASILCAFSQQTDESIPDAIAGVKPSDFSSLRAAILISGFLRPLPVQLSSWYKGDLHSVPLPSLHIWGAEDDIVAPRKSEALSAIYSNSTCHVHNKVTSRLKGHIVPQQSEDCARIVAFLNQHCNQKQ